MLYYIFRNKTRALVLTSRVAEWLWQALVILEVLRSKPACSTKIPRLSTFPTLAIHPLGQILRRHSNITTTLEHYDDTRTQTRQTKQVRQTKQNTTNKPNTTLEHYNIKKKKNQTPTQNQKKQNPTKKPKNKLQKYKIKKKKKPIPLSRSKRREGRKKNNRDVGLGLTETRTLFAILIKKKF